MALHCSRTCRQYLLHLAHDNVDFRLPVRSVLLSFAVPSYVVCCCPVMVVVWRHLLGVMLPYECGDDVTMIVVKNVISFSVAVYFLGDKGVAVYFRETLQPIREL